MLIQTRALPSHVIVDPERLLPRFWATAWSLNTQGHSLSENTRKLLLRHIDAFYLLCDERFGHDSFDEAVSRRDAARTQEMVEAFYLHLTMDPDYTSTAVQRWEAVRGFVQHLARRLSPLSSQWSALSDTLRAMGKMRRPSRGRFRFIRALPSRTIADLLQVAHPSSSRNPFKGEAIRVRNWLIVNLLLLAGLRRGELMLLACDSLKADVDLDTGELMYWLDVTTVYEEDPRSTRPSIKTRLSHRQVPVSGDLANLYEHYVAESRDNASEYGHLLTAKGGAPLSAESISKVLVKTSEALSPEATKVFSERTGGKKAVSPHDLRHTCATARWSMFMAHEANRELTLQRMRAFFGWSVKSAMPEHYARAAVQEDLLRTWNTLFDTRVNLLRGLST